MKELEGETQHCCKYLLIPGRLCLGWIFGTGGILFLLGFKIPHVRVKNEGMNEQLYKTKHTITFLPDCDSSTSLPYRRSCAPNHVEGQWHTRHPDESVSTALYPNTVVHW